MIGKPCFAEIVVCLQDQGCDFYLIKGNSSTTSSVKLPSSVELISLVELPTEMDFSQDKNDKYDLLSIGNKSTSASKAIDTFCVAPQDRQPIFCKDGSDSTNLHVSNVVCLIGTACLVDVAGRMFAGYCS